MVGKLSHKRNPAITVSLVAFRFSKSSAVVVGAFNVYIIQPPFIVETGIVQVPRTEKEDTAGAAAVRFQVNVNRPGCRFSFLNTPYEWIVRPDKVVVETKLQHENCGQVLSALLEHLPWTPLDAVGTNSHFRSDTTSFDFADEFWKNYVTHGGQKITQNSWHISVESDDHVVHNIQLSRTEEAWELNLNSHKDMKVESGSQKKKIEIAQDACSRLFEERELGQQIAAEYFGLEFNREEACHAPNDD